MRSPSDTPNLWEALNIEIRPVLAQAQGQPDCRVLMADERRAARLLLVGLLALNGLEVAEVGSGQEVMDKRLLCMFTARSPYDQTASKNDLAGRSRGILDAL